MAEKSKVKWKKWVLTLAALVAIAIVIVTVVFTMPKNINKVKEKLASYSETVFLQDDEESQLYSDFLTKIENFSPSNSDKANNAEIVAEVMQDMLAFYDQTLIFAANGSTFQREYSNILSSLEKAEKQQQSLMALLNEIKAKVDDSSEYTQWAWEQFEEQFTSYATYLATAISSTSKVYADCIPQGNLNNPLVALTLQTVNDFLNVSIEQKFENNSQVSYLASFTSAYLCKQDVAYLESPIFKVAFSAETKANFESLQDFSTIYTDATIKDVISSIEDGEITFQQKENDGGSLDSLKSFLSGGLK